VDLVSDNRVSVIDAAVCPSSDGAPGRRKRGGGTGAAGLLGAVGLLTIAALAAHGGEASRRVTGHAPRAGRPSEYVGTKRCRMCHDEPYASLRESPKANAWEALKPGTFAAVKRQAGLDLSKDYTEDEACLRCHATGFGSPGGYKAPAPGDAQASRDAEERQGVGCESCHGPGSEFVEVMGQIARERRRYRFEEVRAAGRRIVGPDDCRGCHNDQARCMIAADGSRLHRTTRQQIEALDRTGFHEKIELEYRIEASIER